jgi:hypothetical protein
MRRAWAWWALLSTSGVALIVVPDTSPRIFSLSETHGPSLVDALGIVLLVSGWTILDLATWRRRGRLGLGSGVFALVGVIAAVAAGLVVWSVLGDHGAWWMAGAVILAAIQLLAAARAG